MKCSYAHTFKKWKRAVIRTVVPVPLIGFNCTHLPHLWPPHAPAPAQLGALLVQGVTHRLTPCIDCVSSSWTCQMSWALGDTCSALLTQVLCHWALAGSCSGKAESSQPWQCWPLSIWITGVCLRFWCCYLLHAYMFLSSLALHFCALDLLLVFETCSEVCLIIWNVSKELFWKEMDFIW